MNLENKAVKQGRIYILIAVVCFFSLLLLFGRFIPQEFHPAATTAMVTAILFWFAWLGMVVRDIIVGDKPDVYSEIDAGLLGPSTAGFFMAVTGLTIGVGQSGCSAWILIAVMVTGLLGFLWRDETNSYDYFAIPGMNIVRDTLAKNGLIVIGLLSIPAHFLNW